LLAWLEYRPAQMIAAIQVTLAWRLARTAQYPEVPRNSDRTISEA
jgi:hypothetical protein